MALSKKRRFPRIAEEYLALLTEAVPGRVVWCAAAVALFAVLTFLAALQHPWPDAFHSPGAFSWAWWFHPLENNRTLRLPRVVGSLQAVSAPRAGQVWVVGDGGLILHSGDGGGTWKRQHVVPGSTREPATASPAVAAQDDLSTVQFFDESNGWVGGRPGLFSTSDSGETWVRRGSEAGLGSGISELSFADRSQGCVVHEPQLLCTLNAGRTWTLARFPMSIIQSVSCEPSYCAFLTRPFAVSFINFSGRFSW